MTNVNDSTSITTSHDDSSESVRKDSIMQDYFLSIKKAEVSEHNKESAIKEYIEKNRILSTYFEKECLKDFFRMLFPEGTLQKKGEYNNLKPNVIIMAKSTRLNKDKSEYVRKPYIIFDELENLEYFENAMSAYLVPATYMGGRRLNDNASRIHSMTFDLDDVKPENLLNLLYLIDQHLIPKPTYISNSGHGLHLYYVFKQSISAQRNNLKELTDFKKALTDVLWTPLTSNKCNIEYQSITQGFGLPGSASKLGKGYPVEVYRVGDVTTLHELMVYLSFQAETIEISALETVLQREEMDRINDNENIGLKAKKHDFDSLDSKVSRIKTKFDVGRLETFSKLSLAEAKNKYSEWYEKRIINKQPVGCWKTSEKLYTWWLDKMYTEVQVGKRYHSVAVLAALAYKSGVEFNRLKEDALSMIDHFNQLDGADDKPFKKKDVISALTMYHVKHSRLSLKMIEYKTGVVIKRNKRNGLTREENLKVARLRQIQQLEEGKNWREGNGRKSKEDLVKAYINDNPGKSPTAYARELGVSRPTIYKYLVEKSKG